METASDQQVIFSMSVKVCRLLPSVPSAIADELRMLHLSADVFFELLETVFPLREIGKCRMGFSLVMQAIGTSVEAGALAHAVRAVWQKNHAAWEKDPDGYMTYGALKGACYGLQRKENDPFRYK